MIIKKNGRMRAIALVLLALLILVGGIASAVLLDVQLKHVDKLFDSVEAAEEAPVAIVLGASVMRNGDPSPALRDRLLVGESLYEQGKVSSILITGDDGGFHIDEIKTMREFLLARGIPHEHIREDGHGYRTYESCKRAKEIFGIEKAIVVTQRFHIGRALYLCNELGIETNGVSSDLTSYDNILRFMFRDIGASLKAWWDVNVKAPEPPVEY
ncbi:MAG: ElyC/SanA/YdcF family protein, partial [Patescibacteria group bacterium]